MALPQQIDRAAPADADNPSAGAASIRQLKTFLEDVWGLSDASNYTVAPFVITTLGVVTVSVNPFAPTTTDGVALGSTTKMWSDLFLASGAVINFNNGNVTITHAAGQLTLVGNLLFTDNTYDIGASGATRPRTGYFGTSVVVPTVTATTLTGTLSTAAQTNVTSLGTLASNLIFTDNTYDIGASGATRPRNIYNSGILNVGTGGSPAGQAYIKSAAAGTIPLVVDTAASPSTVAQAWRNNGGDRATLVVTSSVLYFDLASVDLGNNVKGPRLVVGRNENAGAEGQQGGSIQFNNSDSGRFIWVAVGGNVRVNNSAPTGTTGTPTVSDTAGAVVGDQTSWHEEKDILRQWDNPAKALEAVLATKIFDFRYKESSYLDADDQPAVFTGIVGFDRRDPYLKNCGRQQIPCLNEITMLGHHTLSIQALHSRIVALEERMN